MRAFHSSLCLWTAAIALGVVGCGPGVEIVGATIDGGVSDAGAPEGPRDAGADAGGDAALPDGGGSAPDPDGGTSTDADGGGGRGDGGGSDALLPDLIPDEGALERSLFIEHRTFGGDACVVEEACVGGPGDRRLLHFATTTLNLGTADLNVGNPEGNPAFEYSPCHYHWHFSGFADYRLLASDGTIAAVGHKQAFCLMDGTPRTPEAGPPQYHCDIQGISKGWADTYYNVDCQWIDITGVPPGDYIVEIEVNPERVIPELDYTNNIVRAPFTVPPDESQCAAEETCGDNLDQDCDGTADEGCPAIAGNDTCADAHPLVGDGVYRATLDGAGPDVSPTCGGAGADVLFRLDLPEEEIVYASTYGSDVDTVLAVYRNGCAGGGLACEDDGCGQAGEHFVGLLEPGVYFFAVKAKEEGARGEVQLKLQRSRCAGAQPLPDTDVVMGDTSDEVDGERPVCGLGSGPDELWYFAACPGVTPARFSTCGGATFDSMLELREGTCASGGLYACNADDGMCSEDSHASTLDVSLEASTGEGDGLWFLLVDGFAPGEAGPYELSVSLGQ